MFQGVGHLGGGGCCGCVRRCRTSWGEGVGAVVDVFVGVGRLGVWGRGLLWVYS